MQLEFLENLPKIELHAHLNGSLNITSIRELGSVLYGENSCEFLQLTKDFIAFHHDKGAALSECFKKFKFMHDLTATRKGLQLATRMVIRDFAKDNVIYLELRTTPKANEHMSKREYLICVLEAIKEAQTAHKQIKVKLLPSIDRSQAVSIAQETLDIVLELRQSYANIIGIDFSGNPSAGKFCMFKQVLAQARGNGLKLALHCAEIDNPEEIEEMLEFGMHRCGHGTYLQAQQLKQLAQQNVLIECCLSSNVKCATVAHYADHHLGRILVDATKAPVTLCTDDCGVFDTTLTQEYMLATKAFSLQTQDIFDLSMNAVAHAFAEEMEKDSLRDKITNYFKDNACN